MARLSREQIKQAIARQRPGFEVVEQSQTETDAARSRGAVPDAVSPDLEKMRDSESERPTRGEPAGNDDGPGKKDDTIAIIRPKETGTDRAGAGPKQVILDSTGKIVAEQG